MPFKFEMTPVRPGGSPTSIYSCREIRSMPRGSMVVMRVTRNL
jgi:hypothetical protein